MPDASPENVSYYFWKWADNDLPGPPQEVQQALLSQGLHPAAQEFDPGDFMKALKGFMDRRPADEQWNVVVQQHPDSLGVVSFVCVNCPPLNCDDEMLDEFTGIVQPLDLTGFDESAGVLIEGLAPKINAFTCAQFPLEPAYDIGEADLPALLQRIEPDEPDPVGLLENRRTWFVQCFLVEPGFFVLEWRENYDLQDLSKFAHWRAQHPGRLAALKGPYSPKTTPTSEDPNLLSTEDALEIFQAFLRSAPRPDRFHWADALADD
jgi:hypothetical protein